MSELVFYEKPGCIGNGMQKSLLRNQGVSFVVRDLLSHPWTAASLRDYFGTSPVTEWFNSSAPAVKSGEIAIGSLSEADLKQSGFIAGPVLDALEVDLDPEENLQDCPMDASQPVCEDSG
ncbi:MAG: nitrogenase-associated protein [Candidatus Thiodiazotropha sp.]